MSRRRKKGATAASEDKQSAAFRFYDNRQKYLLFVSTCSEKWVVAERVGLELGRITPRPPGLQVFDAGRGDGTVLTRTMRHMHRRFPTTPYLVVGKEISLEDVGLWLEKRPSPLRDNPMRPKDSPSARIADRRNRPHRRRRSPGRWDQGSSRPTSRRRWHRG